MGSGLILLVIVGAWLAVLVPMALRSHDAGASMSSVDRFNDAMRVLSRRDSGTPSSSDAAPHAADDQLLADDGSLLDGWDDVDPRPGALARFNAVCRQGLSTARRSVPRRRPHAERRPVTAAARRRRVVGLLLLLAVGTAVAGLVGPPVLLTVAVAPAVLLVGYLLLLRAQALKRAGAAHRDAVETVRPTAPSRSTRPATAGPAARQRPVRRVAPAARSGVRVQPHPASAPAAAAEPSRVSGVPDRMPARPAPLSARARRYEDPLPAAIGEAWQPVPVPVPTYVNAPVAPPRPPRTLDVTASGQWTEEELAAAEREVGIVDDGPALDDILERRRAVGGW